MVPVDRDSDGTAESSAGSRLTKLFKLHGDAIYSYASQRVPAEDADDVVSEVFLVAWRRLDDVKQGEERPWLFGVARRVVLAHRRHMGELAGMQRRADRQEELSPDLAEQVVERTRVLDALASLTERDREALLLTYWHDLPSGEAAKVLGCSRTAFAVRLHRARSRMARMLELSTRRKLSPNLLVPQPPQRSS